MISELVAAVKEGANRLLTNAEQAFLNPSENNGMQSPEKSFLEAGNSNSLSLDESKYLPKNHGQWDGEPGDSVWHPEPEIIPKTANPEQQNWSEIHKKNEIDGISFNDGYPDFSKTADVTVKIDDFSSNRDVNFAQADRAGAENWNQEVKQGRTDWKTSEFNEYRKENNFTWHECEDMETLQLVPSEIHANIPHQGGIANFKKQNAINGVV